MEIARNLDHTIFNYFYQIANHNQVQDKIIVFVAMYLIYTMPVLLIILWFWSEDLRKVALKATTAGVVAWLLICRTIAIFYFRARPFVAQVNTKELVFHRPTYSFPSDHAAFLFALSFTFWLFGYRKLSIGLFIVSIVISTARIIVGIHYPADIIAGFIVGLVAAGLIWYLRKQLDIFFKPIIIFAKKIRLA